LDKENKNTKKKNEGSKWFWFAWWRSNWKGKNNFFLSISNEEISSKRRGIKQNKKELGHLPHKKKTSCTVHTFHAFLEIQRKKLNIKKHDSLS